AIPWPRTRKRFPPGVPAGILIETVFSSSVSTLTLDPSVACAMFTGACTTRSSPSRDQCSSGFTWNVIMMSPGGPPCSPRPPCPFSRIFDPVSTPVGTEMFTFLRLRCSPDPPHVGHFVDGTVPFPRHIGNGRFTANPPSPNEISPRPPPSGQLWIFAPGAAPLPLHVTHSSLSSSSIGTLPPSAAVRNGMSSVVSTLCPCSGPLGRWARPAPPPNMELNRSPSPPRPPTSNSSNVPPPGPPAGPRERVPPGRAPPPPREARGE